MSAHTIVFILGQELRTSVYTRPEMHTQSSYKYFEYELFFESNNSSCSIHIESGNFRLEIYVLNL